MYVNGEKRGQIDTNIPIPDDVSTYNEICHQEELKSICHYTEEKYFHLYKGIPYIYKTYYVIEFNIGDQLYKFQSFNPIKLSDSIQSVRDKINVK